MKIPPHLPLHCCDINDHKLWQRLKLFFVVAIFGLIAGMSGASIILGWVWPNSNEGDYWLQSYAMRNNAIYQLEDRIKIEMSERSAEVYRGSIGFYGNNYLNKKIGDAIMVSSDGWLVMYAPDYDRNFKNLYLILSDGSVNRPEKALLDNYSDILYLKIVNKQFKITSFAERSGAYYEDVFVNENGGWQHTVVGQPKYNLFDASHLDGVVSFSYSLEGDFTAGSTVINSQGRLLGLVNKNGSVIPAVVLTKILPSVLNKQKIIYPSLGAEGWFSEDKPLVVKNEKVGGFAVNKIWSSGSLLKKGDLILEINGQPVAAATFGSFLDSESVRLTVLRNGKNITIETKILNMEI
ncbi:MAG: S1C family serine protease [Patescibacteria group bacterium]|nr:S1C family serine protease [Patescibacteria group bacterium]